MASSRRYPALEKMIEKYQANGYELLKRYDNSAKMLYKGKLRVHFEAAYYPSSFLAFFFGSYFMVYYAPQDPMYLLLGLAAVFFGGVLLHNAYKSKEAVLTVVSANVNIVEEKGFTLEKMTDRTRSGA